MLITKLCFCSDNVKVCLFKLDCSSLYGTKFWYDSSASFMIKRSVGSNNSLWQLMKLDKHCTASGMFVRYDIPGFGELQRKHITICVYRVSV